MKVKEVAKDSLSLGLRRTPGISGFKVEKAAKKSLSDYCNTLF